MRRNEEYVAVRLLVTVHVDPADGDLLERFDKSSGSFSVVEIVRSEIESNLESVPYVRRVSVKPTQKEVKT